MENSPGADFEVWFYDGKYHLKMVIFFPLVYNLVVFFLIQHHKSLRCIVIQINYTAQCMLIMLTNLYLYILS